MKKPFITYLITFLAVLSVGLYYRTFSLQRYWSYSPEKVQKEAEPLVREWLAKHGKTSDPAEFEKAMDRVLKTMPGAMDPGVSRFYLLGNDSYHFFYLTQVLQETGRIPESAQKGKFRHPLRLYPHGAESTVTYHPYLGLFWHRLLKTFRPDITLMDSANFFPLALTAAVLLMFLLLCSTLRFHWVAAFFGSLALMLSPIFLQRSVFGWYDTDPYNLLFPLTLFYLFFKGIQSKRGIRVLAPLAGLLTALYAFFWIGWPFIFLSILVMGFSISTFHFFKKNQAGSAVFHFSFVYLISTLVSCFLFLTPQGFFDSIFEPLRSVIRFSARETEPWPNVFTLVRETQGTTLKNLIALAGNPVSAVFAVIGVFGYAWNCRKPDRTNNWGVWLGFLFLALSLMFLSLRTVRFALLFLIPFTVWVMWGIQTVVHALEKVIGWFFKGRFPFPLTQMVIFTALFFMLFPIQKIYAKKAVAQNFRVVNDAWYGFLSDVRAKTPDDAVIVSWWPSGYFIIALGHRRVFTDPGSQHRPETYWVSRFFLSQNEKEALGILRMLNTGGNGAVDLLLKNGFHLAEAVDLLMERVPLSAAEAGTLSSGKLSPHLSEKLLEQTHGASMPPTYVLLHPKLLIDNMAMTLMARWNFHEAREKLEQQQKSKEKLQPKSAAELFRESVDLSGGLLHYEAPRKLLRRQEDTLIFENDLKIDLKNLETSLKIPNYAASVKPHSLFYLEEGILKEKMLEGERIEGSVLFWEENGTYRALLAHPELIRSLLFRLYYLSQSRFSHFKLVSKHYDVAFDESLYLYQVDWKSFNTPSES